MRITSLVIGLGCWIVVTLGADWPCFRGPGGSGVSDAKGLPTTWSDDEGIVWKTALPGAGSSSPIVSAGRIFVTCYSGYGVEGASGSIEDLKRHVVCIDPKAGKILWDRAVDSRQPEERYQGIGVPQHGYASSTPVADGKAVYAFFGKTGVIAYDFDGKELWRAAIAEDPRTHMFGSGSSPVLHESLLIVPASVECEEIVAFDKRTGREAWRSPAAGYSAWWTTPVLAKAGDRTELIVSVTEELWGLNPETGGLYWYAESFQDRGFSPSPVVTGGVAYVIGGREGNAAAVRIGGKGDATASHRLWTRGSGSYVPSPVALDGHLYWVTDRGIAYCLKADTGDVVYQERLANAGSVYASAVAADGKLYVVSRRSGTFVLAAKPEFRQLAVNKLESDSSDFNGSPAVCDGKLLLRSNRALYCIGTKKE